MANEKAITNDILEYLRDAGVMAWKAGAGPYQRGGISDILGVLPDGKFLAIEVKDPSRKSQVNAGATKAQVKFIDDVRDHKGMAMVVTSADTVAMEISGYLSRLPKPR